MNPLRIDDKPGEDTRHLVRAVLSFMRDAFMAISTTGADPLSESSSLGVSSILSVCADALREVHDVEVDKS